MLLVLLEFSEREREVIEPARGGRTPIGHVYSVGNV
jgi:hypothetical protein